MAPLIGIALGLVTALPLVVAIHSRANNKVASGLIALLVSFALAHVGFGLVWKLAPRMLVVSAVAFVVTFLAVVTTVAIRQQRQ